MMTRYVVAPGHTITLKQHFMLYMTDAEIAARGDAVQVMDKGDGGALVQLTAPLVLKAGEEFEPPHVPHECIGKVLLA